MPVFENTTRELVRVWKSEERRVYAQGGRIREYTVGKGARKGPMRGKRSDPWSSRRRKEEEEEKPLRYISLIHHCALASCRSSNTNHSGGSTEEKKKKYHADSINLSNPFNPSLSNPSIRLSLYIGPLHVRYSNTLLFLSIWGLYLLFLVSSSPFSLSLSSSPSSLFLFIPLMELCIFYNYSSNFVLWQHS